MDAGQLWFTIGCARSGKSTICKQMREKDSNLVILSGDTFRKALYDGVYNRLTEPFIFSTIDVCARALLLDGIDVIIDETCTDIRTVMRYLAIDPYATPILVDTPEQECIRRALINKQHYLVSVIEWQAKNLAKLKPLLEKDFKEFRDLEILRKKRDKGEPSCQPPELSQFLVD